MNIMSALLIRSSVLMAVALVLGFSATRSAPAAHAPAGAVAHAAAHAPALPVVELPTISVRPSAADLMAAQADDADAFAGGGGALIDAATTDEFYDTLRPALPSLRMNMPYYSFGKVLRRSAKE